ncbi:MAG: hypothetical protein JW801_03630 [Bacteroidales bacterium]|nr:hypothetical protein [Bacteroidales bacterium]
MKPVKFLIIILLIGISPQVGAQSYFQYMKGNLKGNDSVYFQSVIVPLLEDYDYALCRSNLLEEGSMERRTAGMRYRIIACANTGQKVDLIEFTEYLLYDGKVYESGQKTDLDKVTVRKDRDIRNANYLFQLLTETGFHQLDNDCLLRNNFEKDGQGILFTNTSHQRDQTLIWSRGVLRMVECYNDPERVMMEFPDENFCKAIYLLGSTNFDMFWSYQK